MALKSELPGIDRTVLLADLNSAAEALTSMTEMLREQILAPRPRKHAPVFTSSQVADLCGIDRSRLNYLANKHEDTLPPGELQGNGRSRVFTLADVRAWVQAIGKQPKSPLQRTGKGDGKVVTVCNFKGGSCKTSTTMSIAQSLTLRGRKVLVVDLDPQASLTELCGMYAEKILGEENTVLPYITDPENEKLADVILPTYWDGLSVIPAHPLLFAAEFHIPALARKHMQGEDTKFWDLLKSGLEPLRADFDYILIDTAPSLSYLTLNGLFAADSIVMPLVPESLDFISSVSFWSLVADFGNTILPYEPDRKFDFISILLTKVDSSASSSAPIVRSWAQRAYGPWLSGTEVPSSTAVSASATTISTVFDMVKGALGERAIQRVKQPLTEYANWIDDFYAAVWETNHG